MAKVDGDGVWKSSCNKKRWVTPKLGWKVKDQVWGLKNRCSKLVKF